MSTQTYNLNNAAIKLWTDLANVLQNGFGGVSSTQTNSMGSEVSFDFVGTGVTIGLLGAFGTYAFYIDGVQQSADTSAGSHMDVSFSGLTDALHSMRVVVGTSSNTGYLHNSNFTTITGSNPSIQAPTATSNPHWGNAYLLSDATVQTHMLIDGSYSPGSFSGWNYKNGGNPGSGIKFQAKCSELWVFSDNGTYQLVCDGVIVVSTDQAFSGFGWHALATGLDASNYHTYEIIVTGLGGLNRSYGVRTVGGDVNQSYSTSRENYGYFGDSISTPQYVTGKLSGYWCWLLSNALGKGCGTEGIGGTAVQNSISGGNAGQTRTGQMTGIGVAPTKCFVLYGTNDVGSQAGFQAAYLDMMTKLVAGLPNCTFYCLAILPRSDISVTSMNTSIATVVSSFASPKINFVDTSTWGMVPGGDYTVYFGGGGVHPNDAGGQLMAAKLATLLAPPSPILLQKSAATLSTGSFLKV